MDRLRSALFVDFDNIFRGLLDLDRRAAITLASDPVTFLGGLARHGLAPGTHRDLLVRRAYLDPNGWVEDELLGNERKRLYLQRFRPNLTRAGFEVIDCPALTSGQKNAADIRIVIDVLTALDQHSCYDEIIVASSDADFTPLLWRIRAVDRRATIITAGHAAPAYQAVAHTCLDEVTLIALLTGEGDDDGDSNGNGHGGSATTATHAVPAGGEGVDGAGAGADGTVTVAVANGALAAVPPPTDSEVAAVRRRATDILDAHVAEAAGPVFLSDAGHVVHRQLGDEGSAVLKATNWFGTGSLSNFAHVASGGRIVASRLHLWDGERHAPPANGATGLPPLIAQLSAVTDMPRLPSDRWPDLFRVLAEYTAAHEFNLTQATAWSRDRLTEGSTPVGRQVVGFVVRGATSGGVRFNRQPPPSAGEIRDGFRSSVVDRARAAGLDLDDAEQEALAAWLDGAPVPA